jgi:hypothetical protein
MSYYKIRPWSFIRDVNHSLDFITSLHTNKAKAYKAAEEVS